MKITKTCTGLYEIQISKRLYVLYIPGVWNFGITHSLNNRSTIVRLGSIKLHLINKDVS